jgi:hypothetical protein
MESSDCPFVEVPRLKSEIWSAFARFKSSRHSTLAYASDGTSAIPVEIETREQVTRL